MKKILIIEDDNVLSKVLQDELTKAGFAPIYALDAMQGQQAVSAEHPDLVLLDLMLPAGNGVELLRNFNVSVKTQHIPIIVMTSFRDDEVRKEMEAIGIQGFFQKPFKMEELINSIKTILGK
jgi:DNA-binding response OmpR family regulator